MNNSVNVLLNQKYKNMKNSARKKSKVDINMLTTEKIIEILNKHQEKSLEEISILKYYCLHKTKIIEKFEMDNVEESSYDIILSLSLPSSYYKNIKNANTTVINMGEQGDYLFIILSGKAAKYDIQKINADMPGYEYFLLLNSYKDNNEKYLLEKTISENNMSFPIDLEDIDNINKIVLKIILNKQEKKILPNYLDLMLEKASVKYSDFKLESYIDKVERRNKNILKDLDLDLNNMSLEEKVIEYQKMMIFNVQEAWNTAYRNEKKILEELNFIDIEMIKKYMFLTKTKNIENITYYKCTFNKTLEDMDYFGDIEHKIYINKIVSLTDDLKLFCFKTELYNEFVRRIKSKLLSNKINFLLDNFFFGSIFKGFFEKYYFKYFELIHYKMKQIIIKENDPILFCYFIKSGKVKLSSNRSIIENHILIELLKNIISKNSKYKDELNTNINLNELYSEIKNNIEYLNDEINIKNNTHLMTLQANNCIGCELYYYGLNSLYTAEANSEEVEVYKIPTDKLMKILKDKNHKALYYYEKYSQERLKLFFERLLKLNNMLLVNMKKTKIRHFGNLYNFERIEPKKQSNRNYKRLNNIINKFSSVDTYTLFNSKSLINVSGAKNSTLEKGKDKENDKNNGKNNDINNKNNINFFLTTQKSQNSPKIFSSPKKKKCESVKKLVIHNPLNLSHNVHDKDKNTNKRNINSFNLFPLKDEKDNQKDLTSYIKIFDYKDNLQKQENRELQRANMALELLSKAERKQIEKLKRENRTYQSFLRMSSGENRSFVFPFENISHMINNGANELKRNYSNNNIIDLYQRNVFNKNRMLMTSLYKNKFSEYFDKNFGNSNFKYDMRKTLLMNKKKFEYSIFENKFPKEQNKAKSSTKRKKLTILKKMKI